MVSALSNANPLGLTLHSRRGVVGWRLLLCLEFGPSYLRERSLENEIAQLGVKRYQHSSVRT
jgi:hypothetical protein